MRLRNNIRAAYVAMFTSLLAAPVFAAEGSAIVPFRNYTVHDGLTQSNVRDIDQDKTGYLWFTTARGLNRFDGKDFYHYTIADGLPNNGLTAVHVDAENFVWVGDQNGNITAIEGTRVVRTVASPEDANKPVLDLEHIDRRILAVIEKVGIVEVTDDAAALTHFVGDPATGITGIEILDGEIWVETTTGLYQVEDDGARRLRLLDESIRKIHVDAQGTLWVADESGGVGIWVDGRFQKEVTVDTEHALVSIETDNTGLVWVATKAELFSFGRSRGEFDAADEELREYDGVSEITSLYVDRENSLWLSTESRLSRFLGDRFRHFRLRKDNNLVTVWTIAEDSLGRYWFGSTANLMVRELDETLTIVDDRYGLPSGKVRNVVSDGTNRVWVGVTGHGLYAVDTDTYQATHVDGTRSSEILDIAVAHDGAVWFSTIGSGVYRYDPVSVSLRNFQSPGNTSVYTLDVWSDGTVWYGADDFGLIRLQPGDASDYVETKVPGSENEGQRLYDHIRLTGPDSAWVATEEGGVFYFADNKFSQYGLESPLSDQTVYLIEPLENGTVVVGGEQGLYQFVPGESRFVHYNPQVGFIGLETNVHASYRDSAGNLWIGTVDGATRMDVTQEMPVAYEPTPNIVRVETELDRRPMVDNEEIKAADFGAHIEFAAISLLAPKGTEYSYKLVGEDTAWSSPTTNKSVSFPRLPPGTYEFVVRARFPGGEWGSQVASRRFTVLPHFWQTSWFVAGVIVAVLLIIRLTIGYRTRKIEWLNNTLRAQVDERTKSIDLARKNLEDINARLSEEVVARSELEIRFRQAFENAPIGMGLLDADGRIFDSNPALRGMFGQNGSKFPTEKFVDIISDDLQATFNTSYELLVKTEVDDVVEKYCCHGADDETLHAVINLSAVRSDSGDFLYTVLQVQDVTESLKLTNQLEYQASYDELTELLNRRAFAAQLEKAWETEAAGGGKSYLMFMDLDQFKVVNDTSGHTAGDQLLRAVSNILIENVRSHDIVGRLGGDEFGIILWECPANVAKRIAEAIRSQIENFRFHWDTKTYRIGVSIGGVPVDRKIGDINELQQLADAACYAAKEAGRNRVHMVDGDADTARVHRGQVRWVQRIREAMDHNRFAIYAQPIRRIIEDPNEPERLEILLRLRDPESRKLIPPGAFLPAAERYGLSVELDRWVVESLLDTLFIHSAFQAEQRCYWINLSGSSVGDKRFAEFLKDAIARSPLPPGTINFEITETAVIQNVGEAGELMTELRQMGCQFALDDFGSGLSSFGYLKKLPVDYLKIDGMFVRDILKDRTDQIFVKSIIDIAKTLNIKTVAEFVESDEILQMVGELGAEYAQGFAIGRPFELAPRFPKRAGSDLEIVQARAG